MIKIMPKRWIRHHLHTSKILLFLFIIVFFGTVSICHIKNKDFDVDLVYLWCDGEDPAFVEHKNEELKKERKELPKQAIADGRFVQVDELKYSLRSVEKYAPWVHHIYIVTDRQVPKWLNTKHPKITIVDHSEIIPQKYLPLFNSNAIETGIYKIPGLAEHFLYANDDAFFNRPLGKDFFFLNGKPIIRMFPQMVKKSGQYHKTLNYAINLMERDFGKITPFSERKMDPHHNVDSYLKSDYSDCVEHYSKEYTKTLTHRFRKDTSVQRLIVSMWSFMKGNAELKEISRESKSIDSLLISNTKKNYLRDLRKYDPGLFCINDTEKSSQADRKRLKHFLDSYFPDRSSFEK